MSNFLKGLRDVYDNLLSVLLCAFVFARSDWIDLGLLLASERWTPNMQKVHSYI